MRQFVQDLLESYALCLQLAKKRLTTKAQFARDHLHTRFARVQGLQTGAAITNIILPITFFELRPLKYYFTPTGEAPTLLLKIRRKQ